MEAKVDDAKFEMHCIRCGGTDINVNTKYFDIEYKWYKCANCGLEFRPDRKNKEDGIIYASDMIFVVERYGF